MAEKNAKFYKLMAEDYNCYLFPVYMVWHSASGPWFKKITGKRFKYGFFDFERNNWRFGGIVKEWEDVGNHILQRIIRERENFF